MSDDGCDSDGAETKVGDGGLGRLDRYLDALSNQRCRYVLYHLQNEETATISDLAMHVAATETNRVPSAVPDQESESVQLELQHNQLPRLADYGLLEFDPRTGDVRFDDPPETFLMLLRLCHIIERPFD